MMDDIQKQVQRAVLWEQAVGLLRAIDHTFYDREDEYHTWVKFREKFETERRDYEPGGF